MTNPPKQFDVPILFLIFNRPDYTRKTFEEIRRERPTKLFVVADGPRTPAERVLCRETRAIIESIDWPCTVEKNYSDVNMGLKNRISSGITWFFEHVEEGIILEDDCLPHPSFFAFSKEMLEHYRHNPAVMMITGNNYLWQDTESIPDTLRSSYFFSRYASIWGWATWRRAWKLYDIGMKGWPAFKKSVAFRELYKKYFLRKSFFDIFEGAYTNKIDTWGTRWFFAVVNNNGLVVTPARNLISNIGVDGVNTPGSNQNLPTHNIYESGPLVHPNTTSVFTPYDDALYEKNWGGKTTSLFKARIYTKIISAVVKNNTVKKIYRVFARIKHRYFGYGIFENVNHTNHQKNCLVLYLTDPFKTAKTNYNHQNYEQTKVLAATIGEFGFNVDVIRYNDTKAKLTKQYDLIIDIHPGLNPVYRNHMTPGCKKVFYSTGSDPVFLNAQEKQRLLDLKRRRGVLLKQERSVKEISLDEYRSLDAMFFMGNTNVHTYDTYGIKKISHIVNTGYTFLREADGSQRSPKNFLFLSGTGAVQKGLDLLLEVFATLPDFTLYIAGKIDEDTGFTTIYKKELNETPNIHRVGFLDVNSFEFTDLAKKCAFVIAPSCSEGQPGGVLAGMSAGLIPVTSKECGFPDDLTHNLPDNSIETITTTVKDLGRKPQAWISAESERAMHIIETTFTMDSYREAIRRAMRDLLNN